MPYVPMTSRTCKQEGATLRIILVRSTEPRDGAELRRAGQTTDNEADAPLRLEKKRWS